jgi:hypothetical protein
LEAYPLPASGVAGTTIVERDPAQEALFRSSRPIASWVAASERFVEQKRLDLSRLQARPKHLFTYSKSSEDAVSKTLSKIQEIVTRTAFKKRED